MLRVLKVLKFLHKSEHPHFLSVDREFFFRWRWLIKIAVSLNKNYVYCEIYRKKYKHMSNFVVVGLRWQGKNVKRRVSGFAKEYVLNNKNAKCIYCERKLTLQNATTDHIVPISHGGNNVQVNLMICCKYCNGERGNLGFWEYLKIKNPKYKGVKVPFV